MGAKLNLLILSQLGGRPECERGAGFTRFRAGIAPDDREVRCGCHLAGGLSFNSNQRGGPVNTRAPKSRVMVNRPLLMVVGASVSGPARTIPGSFVES